MALRWPGWAELGWAGLGRVRVDFRLSLAQTSGCMPGSRRRVAVNKMSKNRLILTNSIPGAGNLKASGLAKKIIPVVHRPVCGPVALAGGPEDYLADRAALAKANPVSSQCLAERDALLTEDEGIQQWRETPLLLATVVQVLVAPSCATPGAQPRQYRWRPISPNLIQRLPPTAPGFLMTAHRSTAPSAALMVAPHGTRRRLNSLANRATPKRTPGTGPQSHVQSPTATTAIWP